MHRFVQNRFFFTGQVVMAPDRIFSFEQSTCVVLFYHDMHAKCWSLQWADKCSEALLPKIAALSSA